MMREAPRARCGLRRSVTGSRVSIRRTRELYWIEAFKWIGQDVAVAVFHPRVSAEYAVDGLNPDA